jgi:hypothetical protein
MLLSVCGYAPDTQHVFSHVFTSLNWKRILLSSKWKILWESSRMLVRSSRSWKWIWLVPLNIFTLV